MNYADRVALEPAPPRPLRRLVLLKEAMTEVAERMVPQLHRGPANTFQDKLGSTMRFIRAAEAQRLLAMRKAVQEYPYLTTLINHVGATTRTQPGMQAVRDHAIMLARKSLAEDLHDFQRTRNDMEDAQAQAVKERLHQRLRRLSPGACNTITLWTLRSKKIEF